MSSFTPEADLTLPEKSSDPTQIVALIPGAEVAITIVNRESLSNVSPKINKPGAYILLSNIDQATYEYTVYTGISKSKKSGIVQRVKNHKKSESKKWWEKAILISGVSDLPSSVVEKLEDLLIQETKSYRFAKIDNKEDGAKPILDRKENNTVKPIRDVARAIFWMLGYSTEIAKQKQDTPRRKRRISSSLSNKLPNSARAVRLKHLFDVGELQLGDQLVFEGENFDPKITVVEDGNLVVDGLSDEFTGPVKAFKAYRASIGANSTSGLGGSWTSWIVKRSGEKPINLMKIRDHYCISQGIQVSQKSSHTPDRHLPDDPIPSSNNKSCIPVSARAVRLKHLFHAGEINNGDYLRLPAGSHDPKITIVEDGNLVVDGLSEEFNSPMKAFRAYKGSIGVNSTSGAGGNWDNWIVEKPSGKSENLEKIRERYCRNNNIPGKK